MPHVAGQLVTGSPVREVQQDVNNDAPKRQRDQRTTQAASTRLQSHRSRTAEVLLSQANRRLRGFGLLSLIQSFHVHRKQVTGM